MSSQRRRFTRQSIWAFAGWLVLAAVTPVWAQSESGDAVYHQDIDIKYADAYGIALVMDIFRPVGLANGLGVVDVASGAWSSDRGKIEDHRQARIYDIMCQRGYTVFAVRPGSSSKFSFVEMDGNVKQAIRWVKVNSGKFGIDPDSLGLAGASAGGHLASLAALTPEKGSPESGDPLKRVDTSVAAVAAFFPPADFLQWGDVIVTAESRPIVIRMVQRLVWPNQDNPPTGDDFLEALRRVSPVHRVTSAAPPFLLIHGNADPVVPLQQSEALKAALEGAGVPVELVIKEGGGHPWPTIYEEVAVATDWLDKTLTIEK